jgi:hypothetical protein
MSMFWAGIPGQPLLDANGQPVLDDNGNPVLGPSTPAPPVIDSTQVTPTISDVSLLERTRTIDASSGEDVGTFNANTRPTDRDVQQIITVALSEVLAALPSNVDPIWYPAIRRAVALRSAVAIETSFYREQASESGSSAAQYATDLTMLQGLVPKATYIA